MSKPISSRNIEYCFTSSPWKHEGPGGWIFITLPENYSGEIRDTFKTMEEGWGRLPVTARIGKTTWKTAIWFDTKTNAYLLPLKGEIRKKENVALGNLLEVSIFV